MSMMEAVWSPDAVARSSSLWEKERSIIAFVWGEIVRKGWLKGGVECFAVSRICMWPNSSPMAMRELVWHAAILKGMASALP